MLRQLQTQQIPWVKHNFPGRVSDDPLMGVVEEIGELYHHHLKAKQGIRVDEDHELGKMDAIGDIIIYLADYCTAEGYDFEQIVNETWNIVKQRDWIKYPINGMTK